MNNKSYLVKNKMAFLSLMVDLERNGLTVYNGKTPLAFEYDELPVVVSVLDGQIMLEDSLEDLPIYKLKFKNLWRILDYTIVGWLLHKMIEIELRED